VSALEGNLRLFVTLRRWVAHSGSLLQRGRKRHILFRAGLLADSLHIQEFL
jgi:hypothetical protein